MRNRLRSRAGLALALFCLTCTDRTPTGPGGVGTAAFDFSAFLATAAGDPPVPTDTVRVLVRRAADQVVLTDTSFALAGLDSTGDSARVNVRVTLTQEIEDVLVDVSVRGAGFVWYSASTTATLTSGGTATPPPLTLAYVGPGAGADSVRINVITTRIVGGVGLTISGAVWVPGGILTGVPVGFEVADTTVGTLSNIQLNNVRFTGRVPVRDSTWVYAETPTHLRDSVRIAVYPPPAQLVKISGDNQQGIVGVQLAQAVCVRVLDGLGDQVPGVTVNWAVAAGNAGLSTTASVSDSAGALACVLVTPMSAGTVSVRASSGALSSVVFTFTIATSTGPANVTIVAGNGQTAPVGAVVPVAPAVRVTDAGATPLAGVPVAFAVTAGNGNVTGATPVTDGAGIATVGSWGLGNAAGTNTLSATVTGLAPVTFSATGTPGPATAVAIFSGDNQTAPGGTALPAPLVVEVRDAFANGIAGITVDWSASHGSVAPTSTVTNAQGRAQTSWTVGTNATTQSATASVAGLTPAVFNATASFAVPSILLDLVGGDRVVVGGSRDVQVTLTTPAGAGGVTVAVTSDNPGFVAVGAPGTVSISQGQSQGVIALNGISQGTALIRGNAAGYTEGTLSVPAAVQVLSMPTTLNVAFGSTASLPVQISTPAPAGGTVVSLVSGNPAVVAVTTPTVTIPQGQQTVNATVSGVAPGTTTVTGTAAGFGTAQTSVSTTASLNILESSAVLDQSFGTTVTIQLESQGVPAPAPSPGLTVSLAASNPACVAVPATVTIGTGLVSTTAPLTYGGTATTPCTSTLTVTAPSITSDAINATVNPAPAITLSPTTVGSGLQEGTSGSMARAAGTGGVTVRITSADPALVLVAPNASTPGTPFIDVLVPQGSTSFGYYVQGLEGVTGQAAVSAAAPTYTTGNATHTVVQPALDVISLTTTTTTLTADDDFMVRIGVPNGAQQFMSVEQAIRQGGTAVTATVTTSDPLVAQLVTAAGPGATGTVTIGVGQSRSPSTVAGGGASLDPLTAGITNVSGTIPGFVSVPSGIIPVTVSAPLISISNVTVGAGLQENSGGSLGAPVPTGGTTIRVTSLDPAVALVSPNATTPGTPFIDVFVSQTLTTFNYYVQGVEGTTGTVAITAATPLYTEDTATATVLQPALDVIGVSTSTTTLTADDDFLVRIGIPNGGQQFMSVEQNIRAGGTGVTATVTTSDSAVGQLVTLGQQTRTATVNIVPGQSRSPASVLSGGVALDPLGAGTTTVSATIPSFVTLPGASVTVTISAPVLTISNVTVGAGLQENTSGSLGAPAPTGGVTIRVTSSDPALALVSPNATTPGTPFIDIFVSQTLSSFNYYVQGVEGVTGTATITASTALFTPDTATTTVLQPALDVIGVSTTTTTLTADDDFLVRVGIPNGGQQFMSVEQVIRAGGTGLTATLTSSAPGVGTLITTAQSGATVTVAIAPLQSRSPSTVPTGGVALDPLTAGTTTISGTIPGVIALPTASVLVTVNAPALTISSTTVGAGLQTSSGGSLGAPAPAGGLTVLVTSSNPSVALVSPNSTTPGTPSINLTVNQGQSSFSYYVQGFEGASGTASLTASGSGYTDGTATATVAQPAIDIIGVSTTTTTLTADDPFLVRVGLPNATNQFMSVEQVIRPGGTALTANVTSSAPAVAQLLWSGSPGGSATVTIPVGDSRSPSTVATGGVSLDPLTAGTTTVAATVGGVIILPGASTNVTVSAPAINLSATTVGAGLQEGTGGSLGAPAPAGGVMVQVTSANPAVALVSPNATTPGTASINIPVNAGNSSFSYYVQGVEGTTGNVSITASVPTYTNGTTTTTIVQAGIDLLGVSNTTTTLTADDPFLVRIGVPNGSNQFLNVEQLIRAGGTALTATITSSAPAVAQLVWSGSPGGSATVTINPGESRSPATVATGGVALDPLIVGATTVSATIPGRIATTNATQVVTVSAPVITLSATTVGAGLQTSTSGSLGAPVPAGGRTIHIASANPGVALVAPDAVTPGTASIDVFLNPGATSFNYFVQGVEGTTGIINITASTLDYTDGTTNATVVQAALDINSLAASLVVSAADDPFLIRVGVPNASNQFLSVEQDVRAGGTALTATIVSSSPAVGQLTTTAVTGGTVTVIIPVGQSRSGATVAAGGVAFDPLTTGTTTVSATIVGRIATTNATVVLTVIP